MPTCILVPAYGRKYLSAQSALADWNAGKDFLIAGGPYCSIRDMDILKKEFSSIVLFVNNQNMRIWESWKT